MSGGPISSPQALRQLPRAELPAVAAALRAELIRVGAEQGGHFAGSLGAVELSVALHHLLDTPRDRLIWDVGHQAYAHKALTGRWAELARIKHVDGPSGFLRRCESEYDVFGAGHAGTSISAALGIAEGVFDECVLAIREAKSRGFRVTTNTTFFSHDSPNTVRQVLDFLNDELRVDQMMISPAYAYEKAPDQQHFLPVDQTRELFAGGRRRRWRLNHSPLFLDFLEGKADFDCTAWAIPSFSTLGWQRPCYLMSDGYAQSYRELLETTEWEKYGRGRDPRCANCMAHCGYEPTAVLATTRSLRESLRAFVASI